LLLAVIAFTAGEQAHAQRRSWNWYFGSQAGVTFRNGIPETLTDGVIDTDEGCAVFSNPANGNLMFYTDGMTVWDANHRVMPNGTGLNGDFSTSQSAMIVQWPGTTDSFAIFTPAPITTTQLGSRCLCLMYSVVDMSANGGFGDVVQKNVLLEEGVTEHLAATADCDEQGWWIIARRSSSSEFVSYHFTATGIAPVPTVSPAAALPAMRDVGQMHTSPDGRHLVITAQSGEAHLWKVLRTTGEIHSGISLFDGELVGSTYGASFTRDSRNVYISASISGLQVGTVVYRFRLSSDKGDSIRATREFLGLLPGSTKFAGMQLASDSNIYIGRPDQSVLARIFAPSSASPVLQDSVVTLSGVCRSGLPKIVGWIMGPHLPNDTSCLAPQISVEDHQLCQNDCYTPTVLSAGVVSRWEWSVPGAIPPTSSAQRPRFCFPTPGRAVGRLVASNASGADTTYFSVQVRTGPQIILEPEKLMCKGGSVVLNASGAQAYRWSPATGLSDTTSPAPVASPATTTTYRVIGTDAAGCIDSAEVTVRVVDLKAGPDQRICLGASVRLTADNAESYVWAPAGTLDDPKVQSPLASPTMTTAYTVTMTLGSCTQVDTVVVTVGSDLAVEVSGPTRVCPGERVRVVATGGSGTWTWSGAGVEPSDSASTFVTVTTPTSVIVALNNGDCIAYDTLEIGVGGGPMLDVPPDTSICRGESVALTVRSDASLITWQPQGSLNTDRGPTVTASPTTTTTYLVLASNGDQCSTIDSIRVVVRNSPTISAGPDKGFCVGGAVQISAVGSADTYRWEPATGLSNATVSAPVAFPDQTTLYVVTAERDGCIARDTVLIEVSDVRVTVSGPRTVCIGEPVELIAEGASVYRWDPPTGLSDATIANPIATPLQTTTYRVIGEDRFGCVDTQYVTIEVIDTLGLTIEAGDVTAEAGATDVGIPIYVNVDAGQLPVTIAQLRAAIVHDVGAFLPDSIERGQIVTSVRGTERVTYLVMRDVRVVATRQRVTLLRGTALLGELELVPLSWEDVSWSGLTCPREETIPGVLTITGCNLRSRVLRMFTPSTITVTSRPAHSAVDVLIEGGEPGSFSIELCTSDGRIVAATQVHRLLGSTDALRHQLDLSAVASGVYFVVVRTPSDVQTTPIAWLP